MWTKKQSSDATPSISAALAGRGSLLTRKATAALKPGIAEDELAGKQTQLAAAMITMTALGNRPDGHSPLRHRCSRTHTTSAYENAGEGN
jgi:hypothetical protein